MFFPKGPIDNKLALVQIMAWHGIGDKPLSEPMLTRYAALGEDEIIDYGPVTPFGAIDVGQHWFRWWLIASKPLCEPMLTYNP